MLKEKWTTFDTVVTIIFLVLIILLVGTLDYVTTLESDAMVKELRPLIMWEHGPRNPDGDGNTRKAKND